MTALTTKQPEPASRQRPVLVEPPKPKLSGRSMSTPQRLVVAATVVPLVGIVATTIAGALELIPIDQMLDTALALGEEPAMFVFAAMLWCSPTQGLLGRTQVPVRKMLGILFCGYALSNFVMFVIERGLTASLSAPFLVAGTAAMLMCIPLLLTSSRWAQRKIGMRNWRRLHKLTYVIAFALVLHVVLTGEIGAAEILILSAMIARIRPAASAITNLGQRIRDKRILDRV